MDRVENQQVIDVDARLAAAAHFQRQGRLPEAAKICREILDRLPGQADALHLAGILAHQKGDAKEAVGLITRAIQNFPDNPFYHHNLGLVYQALGEPEKAIGCYCKAVAIKPNYAEAYYNMGAAMQLLEDYDWAIDSYQKALEIQPDLNEALTSIGIVLQIQGKYERAAACFQNAIDLRPQDAELFHHLARALENLGRFDEAVQSYRQALKIQPDHAEVYNDLGVVLRQLGKFSKALSCFQKAVEIKPECAEAHNNLGNLMQDGGCLEAAGASYLRALALKPDFAKAYNNLGVVNQHMGGSAEAIACFRKAIEIQPGYASAYRHLLHQHQKDCSWPEMAAEAIRLDRLTQLSLAAGTRPAEDPFLNLTRHQDPAHNLAVARAWSDDICRRTADIKPGFLFDDRRGSSHAITIGYLSNNFHDHPMAHLLVGLFRLHNPNQFKINCYSTGRADDSFYRRRIRQDCYKFVDLHDMSHLEAARTIYNDRVDILVDLMGHTRGNRMEICALRPAPIQVRYLGLAGTTGADFFDYILTDKNVTPETHASYYSENFVYLPHCYQVNDYRQTDDDDISTTGEPELRTARFVFCSFNQDYKIEPVMFGCWMQILRRVPNSLLWLMVRNKAAKKNLIGEANKRGVNPDRLIFMERLPKKQHLARLKMAGLALDTRIVNGAATTSDALWAGVPVITVQGSHFASRMSASILTAVGLPELVAHSIEEYEALAVQTATDRYRLEELRRKLAKNRLTEPLFDTLLFVDNLEQAYNRMWQIFQTGAKPRAFEVIESPSVDRQNLKRKLKKCDPAKGKDSLTFLPRADSQGRSGKISQNGFLVPATPDDFVIRGIHSTQPARKIAFFCGPNDTFLKGIIDHLAAKHEVRRFKGQTVEDMLEMMKWSHISWFEWCDQLVMQASRLPKVCHMICRLHSYEVFTEMPDQVDWKKIDDLIFVSPHIRTIALSKIPDLEPNVRTLIISNGIDMVKCRFRERGKGFHLAYLGYINHKKNPSLLLQCMRYLVDIDDRYILHIAGEHQEMRSKLYFEHMIKEMELESHVKFYGWVTDIVHWLDDKQYILSTSLLESFGYGIAEAMACGLKPLIHNFVGAKEIYPKKYCFNSIKEFGAMVLSCDYRSDEYRKYIEDNFSLTTQLQKIESLLGVGPIQTEKYI